MTSNPQNSDFQALLQDYMKPVADNGFTQSVLTEIGTQGQQHEQNITIYRRFGLYSAAFIGGIIAAVQLPKLNQLFKNLNVNQPALPNVEISNLETITTSLSQNTTLIGGALIILFALWITLDQRSAEIL